MEMSILGWRKQMATEEKEWWQKQQFTALTIMKIQDGGFIVYEDNNFEMGFAKKLLFADGDIGIVLQYVRDKMTQGHKP